MTFLRRLAGCRNLTQMKSRSRPRLMVNLHQRGRGLPFAVPGLSNSPKRGKSFGFATQRITRGRRVRRLVTGFAVTISTRMIRSRRNGRQAERERQNLKRSRRGLRLSVRGIGKTVQLLTLTTRDVFPWAERARFALAVKHFINSTRHIFGSYVVTAELTRREFCHAHLSVPDKTMAPSGHYAGYTVAELDDLRECWRRSIRKFKPSDYRLRRGLAPDAPLGNIHMTTSRQALGVSTYMGKAASSYMLKEDSKLVFFSHRFRSSRGLVRILPWFRCEQSARPRHDFAAGKCEWYMFAFKDEDDPEAGYCSAIYGLFGPDD